MFWKIQGAQNILDIRCTVLSDTYDDYWEWRKEPKPEYARPPRNFPQISTAPTNGVRSVIL